MDKPMKFYCAGAIRGQLFYAEYFDKVIEIVKDYGIPLTEKLAYTLFPLLQYASPEEQTNEEKRVAERDREMIRQCKAIIAEISGPSSGTGWEICYGTRLYRKPTLCLFHAKSTPSLILKQDNSPYTIVQMYSDESEFETYTRCFLETVTRVDDIGEIKDIYSRLVEISKLNPSLLNIKKSVDSLVYKERLSLPGLQARLVFDMKSMYLAPPKKVPIDFKDAGQMIQFLFKNLLLQRKWDALRSQEIGASFVSGRKPIIINTLARVDTIRNLLEVYNRAGEDRLQYTREAFTKNVRAFRKIGLLLVRDKAEYQRGTKFIDKISVEKTLQEGATIISRRSPRETLSGIVTMTEHLQHLSEFLDKFGSTLLVDFLQRSKGRSWYSSIPDVQNLNIDDVDTSMFLTAKWAQEAVADLHLECKRLWKESYSSFA